MQKIEFRSQTFYVKRDDLFFGHSKGELGLNGNKGRKLQHYINADLPDITTIVSFGSAQSNMLYSLSCLARLRGWKLDFYTDHIAESLIKNPNGNYAAALDNGTQIHAVGEIAKAKNQNLATYVKTNYSVDSSMLFIPEGGHSAFAEQGVKSLADEIKNWVIEKSITDPKVMLPSGTGTTALYLQKHLSFEVLTCACVGSANYLQQQFFALSDDECHHPTILLPPKNAKDNIKKYHFGKCYPEFYRIWQELEQQTNISFELLYDPLGWLCLMEYVRERIDQSNGFNENLIYLHQGGLLGNQSMIARYKRKALSNKL